MGGDEDRTWLDARNAGTLHGFPTVIREEGANPVRKCSLPNQRSVGPVGVGMVGWRKLKPPYVNSFFHKKGIADFGAGFGRQGFNINGVHD